MSRKCDAVFEGGGVRGIGFAGAISELESRGYTFQSVAGTSAGAIAAALIAVGYSGLEIERELHEVNFKDFRQEAGWSRAAGFGKLISLSRRYGVYKADAFEEWLDGLLQKKGKTIFGDIRTGENDEKTAYRLSVVASNLTDNRILILPRDLKQFGLIPDSFPIARAVRMSMSIPLYYEPWRLIDSQNQVHMIVDGGILSNYPIWLLDNGSSEPRWPTFGFKFIPGPEAKQRSLSRQRVAHKRQTESFFDYMKSLVTTMMKAADNFHISESKGDCARSILIPTEVMSAHGVKSIESTDFDITSEESAALCENGRRAAREFLKTWDFSEWKLLYR